MPMHAIDIITSEAHPYVLMSRTGKSVQKHWRSWGRHQPRVPLHGSAMRGFINALPVRSPAFILLLKLLFECVPSPRGVALHPQSCALGVCGGLGPARPRYRAPKL